MSRKKRKAGTASQRRNSSVAAARTNVDLLRQALSWLITENSFANLALHGNVSWTVSQLVSLAVFDAPS